MKGFVAGCLLIIVLLLVGGEVLFYAAGCAGPEETVRAQATSPNGKHTAVLVRIGGDATVGYFQMVALCEGSGGCTSSKGNVVASEKNEGISTIGWVGNDKLIVYYSPSYTTFEGKDFAKDGVTIEYVPKGK